MIKKTKRFPLVSVIIPMFNSAKFIPQTLESLLYQTMKDFEVIVVDDCSTDNSVEVVESFMEKFGGRLRLIKLKKNTGTPGLPRNEGIRSARGKYISFLDSDDLYTKTALEELSSLAEKYQAEVVHLNDTFASFNGKTLSIDDPRLIDINEIMKPENLIRTNWHWTISSTPPEPLPAPTFKPDNLEERVKSWINWGYRMGVCSVFCRRDFLINNQLFFPRLVANEDQIFVFNCLCLAKKFLRVPNVVYIIVKRIGSQSRDQNLDYNAKEYIYKWLNAINGGFNELNELMDSMSFFKKHFEYQLNVLDFFFEYNVFTNKKLSYDLSRAHEVYPMIKEYFHSNNAFLTAYLLNKVKALHFRLSDSENKIRRVIEACS